MAGINSLGTNSPPPPIKRKNIIFPFLVNEFENVDVVLYFSPVWYHL